VDVARRLTINLLFLAVLIILLVIFWQQDTAEVPESAALIVDPGGQIVEQLTGTSRQRALQELAGTTQSETLLKDLVDAINLAREDDRIKALFLNLNGMEASGLTKLQDLGKAIRSFRESGKRVVAAANNYEQSPYYLASMADEIYLDPFGIVILEGYSRYRTYYKEGLDRLEVDWNVFRVGEFKSAVEPFLRNDMSPEAREANLEWLNDLWQAYLNDVAPARGMTPRELEEKVNSFATLIHQSNGDMARAVLEAGLVDELLTRQQIRARMIELVGEDKEIHSFNQIGYRAYLELMESKRNESEGENVVAVIMAKGSIVDGRQPPGTIGGDSTAALIRNARQDDKIKAIVLRVDSGGGSAFASEVIRREFELAREEGKPVVVSMGSVAASGGYWISTASDEIWAHPSTITGSIGIFGMFPTFQRTMSTYLGLSVDGVGTTALAGALRPDREMAPEVAEIFQLAIEDGYQNFLERVAEAREMSIEEVDRIARGRVWSGQDAYDLGLVDRLGGLADAITSAAESAGLGEDFSVRYMEEELKWYSRFLNELLARGVKWAGPLNPQSPGLLPSGIRNLVEKELLTLQQFADPKGIYAACLCEVK
jgi:protease-4